MEQINTPSMMVITRWETLQNKYFWSNFNIHDFKMNSRGHRGGTVESLQKLKEIDISKYKLKNKRQILRNCVEPNLGKFVFDCFLEYK